MIKTCKKCGEEFNSSILVNGIKRNVSSRSYCFKCSPVGRKISREPKYSDNLLSNAVRNSTSMTEVMKYIGSSGGTRTQSHISNRIKRLGLDTSHFVKSGLKLRVEYGKIPSRSLDDILRKRDSGKESASVLRKSLSKMGVPYICSKCGCDGTWMGEPIVIQVDHIDGDNTNNHIDNLRFLCPNCHSQTKTFGSKNRAKIISCPDCGKTLSSKTSKRCKKCASVNVIRKKKFNVSKEELMELVWKIPSSEVAKMFGVSDKAICNRCKAFGISKPPRGYWSKIKYGVVAVDGIRN